MTWALIADLFGTFFFAISGCLLAVGRGYDLVGSLLLGALTGLGGGVIRDVIIGRLPVAFDQPVYLLPPVLAALLVFAIAPSVQRFRRTLLVFDAGGLGLFCTTGTVIALSAGLNPIAAIVLGVTSAVGGGLLRDVVANRDPQLFNPNDLYAVPAFLGAALVVGLWILGWHSSLTGFVVAAFVFLFRIVSLRFKWRIPHASPPRGSEEP